MKDDVIFITDGKRLTACLLCEIDDHAARRLRERIDERLAVIRPSVLTLDFSGVRFMDSSGIALILGRREAAQAQGAALELKGLSPTLKKLIRLAGLDRLENISILSSGRRI